MSKINLIIQKKQFGKILTSKEIEYVVNQYTSGKISDDIMTNWLKAIYHEGMNNEETLSYTQCICLYRFHISPVVFPHIQPFQYQPLFVL